jgi:hypothetical protein
MDTFAEQAKAYWRSWGMLGVHMVRNVDSWTNQQRSYLQWLRQNHAAGDHQPRPTTDQIV